ncbi:MAG: HAD-IC family P-type ATPase, partial [Clostridia bacterium]|nr:HAD-IC family P-type ATPase [Clostridia bacterium]
MHTLKENEILNKLKSSNSGLSNELAKQNLTIYGRNELQKEKKQSFFKRFLKQFLNIMVAILLFSAIASISIAIIKKEYGELFEGLIILFIVIANAFIGVIQESKAQACLDELQKYSKVQVKVLREGKIELIESEKLVPGDIVEMEAGNVVMADIRLLSSNNFSCDESSLTGESIPAEKETCVLKKETPLAERKNMAYSGSLITSGKARGVVVATGRNTEIGKIASLIKNSKKELTPLQKSIDKIGKIITWTVVAVCVIIFSMELISGNSGMDSIMTSVALAVAAIPESLPAVITIILAMGVQQLAKRKCIIKHLHAVETLGCCEIICSDKTGTLTQNKMQVVETIVNLNKNETIGKEFDLLCECMSVCNNAKKQGEKIIGEPTEKALLEFVVNNKKHCEKRVIHEVPFSSARKMMSVVVGDSGVKCFSKGAPEILIKKCKFIQINGEIVDFSLNLQEKIKNSCENMTDKAYRVIAFAYKPMSENKTEDLEENLIFIGLAGLIDNPRVEVKDSIKKCFKAGLKPVMITGDHKRTAFAIAKELGIAKNITEVLTGEELDKLSDKELKNKCSNFTVYARVSPEHKVRIVKAYKSLKKIVAMTGDGVNDAPSLKNADIGVGMGRSGTDVIKSVADLLVTDDNFSSIVIAVEEGRKVYNNIQKALQFLISTNCVEVFGMLIALMFFPKYEFLSASQMLFINLVSDSLPAFALGMEKVEPEVMNSPPRNSHAGLFSGMVGISIIYQAILQTIIAIAVFVVGV